MAVHVARLSLMHVTQVGTVKPRTQMTIGEVNNSNQEIRVIADPNIPNSATNPTVEAFLILEDAAGFTLNHLDQTYCITYD